MLLGYNLLEENPISIAVGSGTFNISRIAPFYVKNSVDVPLQSGGVGIPIKLAAVYTITGALTNAEWFVSTPTSSQGETPVFPVNADFSGTTTPTWTPKQAGYYSIKLKMTQGGTILYHYMYDFYVGESLNLDTLPDVTTIQQKLHNSTNILIHFDQLVLYGGSDMLFYSRVLNFSYIPNSHYIQFVTPQNDTITKCIVFTNTLTVFTQHTIWYIAGGVFASADFRRVQINESIGAISPDSVRVIGNYVYFQAKEGLHILKTIWAGDLRLNVEMIDTPIRTSEYTQYLTRNDTFSNWTLDSYKLYVPISDTLTKCWSFNYILKSWGYEEYPFRIMDSIYFISSSEQFLAYNGTAYKFLMADTGRYEFDDGTTPVTAELITVMDDFGASYHLKKFKKLFLHTHSNVATKLYLTVLADSKELISVKDTYTIVVNPDGTVSQVWTITEENIEVELPVSIGSVFDFDFDTTFGINLDPKKSIDLAGKGYAVQIKLVHDEAADFGVNGFSFTCKFKTKPKVV